MKKLPTPHKNLDICGSINYNIYKLGIVILISIETTAKNSPQEPLLMAFLSLIRLKSLKEVKMYDPILQNARKPVGSHGEKMLLRMNKSHASLVSWGLSFMDIDGEKTILDVGCGGGATINSMLKKFPQALVDGVDFSNKSVSLSKQTNAEFVGKRTQIIKGDAISLPYSDGLYDAVTAVETVYFWSPIEKAFTEVFRILKNGGQFMILCELSDPNDRTWTQKIKMMKVYSANQLEIALKSAGFSDVQTHKGEGGNICVLAMK